MMNDPKMVYCLPCREAFPQGTHDHASIPVPKVLTGRGNLPNTFATTALLKHAETLNKAMVEALTIPTYAGYRGATWKLKGLRLEIRTPGWSKLYATLEPLDGCPSLPTEEVDVTGSLYLDLLTS
jgi:hypothetical protein